MTNEERRKKQIENMNLMAKEDLAAIEAAEKQALKFLKLDWRKRKMKNLIIMFVNGCSVMGIAMGIICQISSSHPWSICVFAGSAIWLILFLFVNFDLRYSKWGNDYGSDYRKKKTKDTGKISSMERSVHHGGSANISNLQQYVRTRTVQSGISKEN